MISRRTSALAAIAALGLVGAATCVPVSAAAAPAARTAPAVRTDFNGSYSGVATADAIHVTVALNNYLIVQQFVDGGGPTAQAALDSLGNSSAFSSLPYPGATDVALPGLASTLTGKSLPSYPLIVNSSYPSTPSAKVTQPGYTLSASSSPSQSIAETDGGLETVEAQSGGSFSTASVTANADGSFVALGRSRTGLDLGTVKLAEATSLAQVSRTAAGKQTTTSSFAVTGLSIGGIQVGVSSGGLMLGTTTVALSVLGTLTQAISMDGTTVQYIPAISTPDSVTSAGLKISEIQPVPDTGGATAEVDYLIGNSYAQADSNAFPAGYFPPTETPPSGSTVPASTNTGSLGTSVSTSGGTGSIPSTTVPATSGTEVQAPAVAAAPTSAGSLVTADYALPRLSFYPVLVLAGVVLLAVGLGARRFTRARI